MEKNRTKNTIRNLIYGTSNQILTMIINFVSRTIFIKVLGEGYLGINGLFSDILMMLSMADLGFGTAMAYSFYQPLAEQNHKKIAALINFYRKIYNCIALVVTVVGIAIVPFLEYLVNLDKGIPYVKIYYLFFLANTVVSYLFVYKTSIINADQKGYLVSRYQMMVNLGKLIAQSISLLLFKNYFVYLAIQIVATIINNLIASMKATQLYPYIKQYKEQLSKQEKNSIFQNMKSVFLYRVSSVLLTATDNVLISVIVGTVWVGLYSNYCMVTNAVSQFISIIYNSVTASLGNVIVTETSKKRYEVFKIMQTVSLMSASFTTVCMALLLNNFICVCWGERFVLEYKILFAVVLNFYLGNILYPIWTYRSATGLYMKTKYIMVICAIVNLILSVILVQKFGVFGIVFSSAIARLSTYFWYEPKLLFGEYFEEKVYHYYIPIILNVFFTGAIIAIMFYFSKGFLIDTWPKMIIKSAIIGVVSLIIVVGAYIKTSGCKMILEKFLKIKLK